MKNFSKNLIQKFREKLELDDPEKYVDGYYQLSRKQKIYWAVGLFLVGFVFIFTKVPSDFPHPLYAFLTACVFFSSLMLVLSFIYSWLSYYPSIWLCNVKEERKKITKKTIIILYKFWTVFLIAEILCVVFIISYNFRHLAFLFFLILFFNFQNRKKL